MEKVIHYCWFGPAEITEKERKCIDSWEKYLPEYEIKKWDETNFDLNCCDYIKEAYEAKKWAFVSDFVRIYVLYHYGGCYFDTDVELIKPMDGLIQKGAFMGREKEYPEYGVNPGLGMAAEKGMAIYKEILDNYYESHFMNEDGTCIYYSIVDRITEILLKYGLSSANEIQQIQGITIYPKSYLCPLDYDTGRLEIQEDTYAIHWFSASWLDKRMRIRNERCKTIRRTVGKKWGNKVCGIYLKFSYAWEYIITGRGTLLIKKLFPKSKRMKRKVGK